MQELIHLSPLCFPERIWKRSTSGHGYAQQRPDKRDIIRREAMAAWQLGECTLTEANAALMQIEELEIHFEQKLRRTLRELQRGMGE